MKKSKKKKTQSSDSEVSKRLAIIDLGTNSVRFDIYDIFADEAQRLFREKRMIKLGEGLFEKGTISSKSLKRAQEAFVAFKDLMEEHDVTESVAFATSALRSAKNAEEVVARIKESSGIEVKVISGERESELISKAIFANLNLPNKRLSLVDIGGGSTEISICENGQALHNLSFDLGASRLQQNFLDHGTFFPDSSGKCHELLLRAEVRSSLAEKSEALRQQGGKSLVGSSGTIRNLGKILKQAGRRSQPFLRKDLAALVSEMKVMSPAQISKIPGLEPKRVDLILAGALLFEEIMYFLGAKHFYVTDLALRDGILEEYLVGPI